MSNIKYTEQKAIPSNPSWLQRQTALTLTTGSILNRTFNASGFIGDELSCTKLDHYVAKLDKDAAEKKSKDTTQSAMPHNLILRTALAYGVGGRRWIGRAATAPADFIFGNGKIRDVSVGQNAKGEEVVVDRALAYPWNSREGSSSIPGAKTSAFKETLELFDGAFFGTKDARQESFIKQTIYLDKREHQYRNHLCDVGLLGASIGVLYAGLAGFNGVWGAAAGAAVGVIGWAVFRVLRKAGAIDASRDWEFKKAVADLAHVGATGGAVYAAYELATVWAYTQLLRSAVAIGLKGSITAVGMLAGAIVGSCKQIYAANATGKLTETAKGLEQGIDAKTKEQQKVEQEMAETDAAAKLKAEAEAKAKAKAKAEAEAKEKHDAAEAEAKAKADAEAEAKAKIKREKNRIKKAARKARMVTRMPTVPEASSSAELKAAASSGSSNDNDAAAGATPPEATGEGEGEPADDAAKKAA